MLQRLARRERIAEPVVLAVAHPDDETLALGALLPLFERLTIVWLTDGAPRDGEDARRVGFADWQAYAAARAAELDAALGVLLPDRTHPLLVAPDSTRRSPFPATHDGGEEILDPGSSAGGTTEEVRRVRLGIADQGTAAALPALVRRLIALLQGAAAVITHAYEGGHPDHDSAAFAVAHACRGLGRAAPRRFEFAGYHALGGAERWGAFWPDPAAPETMIPLDLAERDRLQRALDCFVTQADTLRGRAPVAHRLRPAPVYDFTAPPPPGSCLYERWGFPYGGAEWRAAVANLFPSRAGRGRGGSNLSARPGTSGLVEPFDPPPAPPCPEGE